MARKNNPLDTCDEPLSAPSQSELGALLAVNPCGLLDKPPERLARKLQVAAEKLGAVGHSESGENLGELGSQAEVNRLVGLNDDLVRNVAERIRENRELRRRNNELSVAVEHAETEAKRLRAGRDSARADLRQLKEESERNDRSSRWNLALLALVSGVSAFGGGLYVGNNHLLSQRSVATPFSPVVDAICSNGVSGELVVDDASSSSCGPVLVKKVVNAAGTIVKGGFVTDASFGCNPDDDVLPYQMVGHLSDGGLVQDGNKMYMGFTPDPGIDLTVYQQNMLVPKDMRVTAGANQDPFVWLVMDSKMTKPSSIDDNSSHSILFEIAQSDGVVSSGFVATLRTLKDFPGLYVVSEYQVDHKKPMMPLVDFLQEVDQLAKKK